MRLLFLSAHFFLKMDAGRLPNPDPGPLKMRFHWKPFFFMMAIRAFDAQSILFSFYIILLWPKSKL